jgi:hypothetical protein
MKGCLIFGIVICLFMAILYWWVPGWVLFWVGIAIVLAIFVSRSGKEEGK